MMRERAHGFFFSIPLAHKTRASECTPSSRPDAPHPHDMGISVSRQHIGACRKARRAAQAAGVRAKEKPLTKRAPVTSQKNTQKLTALGGSGGSIRMKSISAVVVGSMVSGEGS